MKTGLLILCCILLGSYRQPRNTAYTANSAIQQPDIAASKKIVDTMVSVHDTTFVNLRDYSTGFVSDMKYATTDNFLNTAVYECDDCYLRLRTVKALIRANIAFIKMGYRIKLFDCYRPLSIQKNMWAIVNNPTYVADPAKGSIHNRGGAVDITLVDKEGNELEMGTPFDHFGIESAHDYRGLTATVISNRQLLKRIMLQNGFESFRSEWWHYNINGGADYKVSDFRWQCN